MGSRRGARAPAPLPATGARGVAGAGWDDPSLLGHLFLGHAGASRTRLLARSLCPSEPRSLPLPQP